MTRRRTNSEFITAATREHSGFYSYDQCEYVTDGVEVRIICPVHGLFNQKAGIHLSGSGCRDCGKDKLRNSRSYNKERFISLARERHADIYGYDDVIWVNSLTDVIIRCIKHGSFTNRPSHHLQGVGCPTCGIAKKTLNTELFIAASVSAHGTLYDYSSTKYVNSRKEVSIGCHKHGLFYQRPSTHMAGHGCKKCADNALTTKRVIEMAREKHGDRYDYSLVNFVSQKTNIKIICRDHGVFEQTPDNHIYGNGRGCKKCGYITQSDQLRSNTDAFVAASRLIHGSKYNYDLVYYHNNSTKVSIQCPKHGYFKQVPASHLKGNGCPSCTNSISKCETEFLDLIGIGPENRQIKIGRYKVDGLEPETKTIWEFDGDFWHGNPALYDQSKINPRNKKTYGELYSLTLKKRAALEKMGYTVRGLSP